MRPDYVIAPGPAITDNGQRWVPEATGDRVARGNLQIAGAMGAGSDVTRRRRLGILLVVAAVAAGLLAAAPPAAAAWTPPAFVETIGGTGRPGVFAWGVQYNPLTDELLVGDYLNYQVRRFNLDGDHLGDFFRSDNRGQPYSIGVDPNDGSVYVPEISDQNTSGTIAKYDRDGNFLYSVDTNARYYAWIAVDQSGDVFILDSHYWNNWGNPPRIRRYRFNDDNQSASQVDSWSVSPSGMSVPRLYGIDVSAGGTIYASDTINNVVHRWTAGGSYLGSFGDGYFVGDLRSVAIDDNAGLVYVVDSHGGVVQQFTLDGVHTGTLGSPGPGDGQLVAPRQATVGPSGEVFVADFGKTSVEEFEPDGTWVGSIPKPPRRSPTSHLAQPRDVAVDQSGNIWVADTWNQRVQKFDEDGNPLATWGRRGSGLYGMNYPRGIAIDPATGNVWVSQERGHYIAVYDPSMTMKLFVVGQESVDSSSTGFLRWPNDIEFFNNSAYVSDRVSDKVKVFDTTNGNELWHINRDNHGVAVDPDSGAVFVVDEINEEIVKYDADGDRLFSFGSDGNGDGQFKEPKDAVVSDGVLWVTDEQLSRVQAFDLNGNFLGKWGGYGSNAYQFRNPVGIAADDAGNLYITDTGNDRVVVYDTAAPRPAWQWSPPEITTTSPTDGQVFSDLATVAGSVTDVDPAANVEIAVLDQDTGLWWNAITATWEPDQTWALAPLSGVNTSRTFSWLFVGASYNGTYRAHVRARDSFDTLSAQTTVRDFSIAPEPGEADVVEPDGTVSVPVAGQSFPGLGPVLEGTATDNIGVHSVDVAIQDAAGGSWWDGSGWGPFTWIPATVVSPGATTTHWSHTFAGPPGSYGMTVRAADAAGNVDTTRPWVPFSVSDVADTTPPDGTVATPAADQIFAPGPVSISGSASDDIGVGEVRLALKDRDTGEWWRGSGWGNFKWHTVALTAPGLAQTDWSWVFDPGSTGSFAVMMRAEDSSGNRDPTKPWVPFTISNDLVPPDTTVTAPLQDATVPAGPVAVAGTATDDVAVDRVQVAVKDRNTGLWWRGSGWGNFKWHDTTLDDPDAASTGWAWTFDPGTAGDYVVLGRAQDGSGNVDPTKPRIRFTIG